MRTIRYTNRFKRDYRREKAGRHGKTLDTELTELFGCSQLTRRCRAETSIIRCPANGAITAIVTCGPTSFSSIESQITKVWNWYVLARIASLDFESLTEANSMIVQFGASI